MTSKLIRLFSILLSGLANARLNFDSCLLSLLRICAAYDL